MLDTNTVGHLVKHHPAVTSRVLAVSMGSLCLSAVTMGELLFGLARWPDATRLHRAVKELLLRVDAVLWDHMVAARYGTVRADMQSNGKTLAPIDLLIATHALEIGAIMVTNDQAFQHVPGLTVEDWTA